jgi:ankyrin repeat protein
MLRLRKRIVVTLDVFYCFAEIAQLFKMQNQSDMNRYDTKLIKAVRTCDVDQVQHTLGNEPELVNVQEVLFLKAPLHVAVLNQSNKGNQIIQLLVEHGANPNQVCFFERKYVIPFSLLTCKEHRYIWQR